MWSKLKQRFWDENREYLGPYTIFPWPRQVVRFLTREGKWGIGTLLAVAALVVAFVKG